MSEKKSGLKKLFSKPNQDCCSVEIEEVNSNEKDCCSDEVEEAKSDAKDCCSSETSAK